jgi:2-polyprenyl-6-hydroxyphenyl methylase / 3-demethylubiquinone-9 3-methyltransferase
MSTVNAEEVAKFSAMAEEWWDKKGKFRPLHQLNPTRLGYIREQSIKHLSLPDNYEPFKGKRVLDIGCGGGLLTEPMARLGANITGIDASEKNISIAKARRTKTGLDIDYRTGRIEDLTEKFDIILNMEVAEHVADPSLFLHSCANLLNPGGIMFVATINRTPKSYLFAILGAEYVLRILPKGTHDWKKFLKPSEVNKMLEKSLKLTDIKGVNYNPVNQTFKLTPDLSVNYMMVYKKENA